MTDGATREVATGEVRSTGLGWGATALLATAVAGTLVAYLLGVARPYYGNDLNEFPASDVARGAYDPKDLPQNAWSGPLVLLGLGAITFGPLVAMAGLALGGGWLTLVWGRTVPHRLGKVLCLSAVVAVSVAAIVFHLWGPGGTMSEWFLD